MVGIAAEAGRYKPCQAVFDLADRAPRREPEPIGHPKDMGVDRDGRLAKGGVEDDIGGFASHSGQRLETHPVPRHLPAVVAYQLLAGLDDVAGLGAVEPDGADIGLEPVFSQGQKARGVGGCREQGLGRLVDAPVRGLSRENNRDQQLEDRAVVKFRRGAWVVGLKPRKEDFSLRGPQADLGFFRRDGNVPRPAARRVAPFPGRPRGSLPWPRDRGRSYARCLRTAWGRSRWR